MARFPDHVVLLDTGVSVFVDDGSGDRGHPAIIVNCLVTVHDTKQDGGTELRYLSSPLGGGSVASWTVYYPFPVLYDVLLSTDDYFRARAFFRGHRKDPQAQQLRGAGNIPNINKNFYPRIFEDGRVPLGVFEYPDRQNVLVTPVGLPGYADPFGQPLDPDRNEEGLSIEYMMVRKEITRLVCERKIKVF